MELDLDQNLMSINRVIKVGVKIFIFYLFLILIKMFMMVKSYKLFFN